MMDQEGKVARRVCDQVPASIRAGFVRRPLLSSLARLGKNSLDTWIGLFLACTRTSRPSGPSGDASLRPHSHCSPACSASSGFIIAVVAFAAARGESGTVRRTESELAAWVFTRVTAGLVANRASRAGLSRLETCRSFAVVGGERTVDSLRLELLDVVGGEELRASGIDCQGRKSGCEDEDERRTSGQYEKQAEVCGDRTAVD